MNGTDLAEHFKAAMEGRAPSLPRVGGLDVEQRYIIRHHELAALVDAALAKPASSPAGGDVREAMETQGPYEAWFCKDTGYSKQQVAERHPTSGSNS